VVPWVVVAVEFYLGMEVESPLAMVSYWVLEMRQGRQN